MSLYRPIPRRFGETSVGGSSSRFGQYLLVGFLEVVRDARPWQRLQPYSGRMRKTLDCRQPSRTEAQEFGLGDFDPDNPAGISLRQRTAREGFSGPRTARASSGMAANYRMESAVK